MRILQNGTKIAHFSNARWITLRITVFKKHAKMIENRRSINMRQNVSKIKKLYKSTPNYHTLQRFEKHTKMVPNPPFIKMLQNDTKKKFY